MRELVVIRTFETEQQGPAGLKLPVALITEQGTAALRFLELFTVNIRNPNALATYAPVASSESLAVRGVSGRH